MRNKLTLVYSSAAAATSSAHRRQREVLHLRENVPALRSSPSSSTGIHGASPVLQGGFTPHPRSSWPELPFALPQPPLAEGALLCSRVFEMLHVATGLKKVKRRLCSRLAALEVVRV